MRTVFIYQNLFENILPGNSKSPGKYNNKLVYSPNQPSTVDLFLSIQSLATSAGSLF
jgi:hypothetical protein